MAGLPVVFDLLGAAALNDFGRRSAERLRAARTRVTATRGAARLLERLRALESRVQSDLTATRTDPGTPEYESLLASLAEAFGGEFTCASCRYAMPQFALVDDLATSSPDRTVYKWECVHGRDIFESQVESFFVDGLSEKDRKAWRNAEDVDRWVDPIGSILLGGLALGSLALIIVEWRVGWERPGLLVAIPIAVVILAALASVVTDPGKRRRAGAVLAWLGVAVCYLPVPMTRMIVWVMNRERPAHPLRWIALGLFIFGSLLDLLAS
ncbi:hypothetical protein [Nocardia thraciensis]